jgi:large subunit ribosomal protein L21
MFAVVRTGGKQYRVTAGDKIVVEKLAGETGDKIDITDILLAGEGSELKSVAGLVVGAEIVAQAKGEKVTVFKKRRRHNYRRKKGHRQQHTILKIVSIGGEKAKAAKPKAEAAPPSQGLLHLRRRRSREGEAPAKKAEPKAKADKAPSTKDAAPAKAAAKKAPKAK